MNESNLGELEVPCRLVFQFAATQDEATTPYGNGLILAAQGFPPNGYHYGWRILAHCGIIFASFAHNSPMRCLAESNLDHDSAAPNYYNEQARRP